MTDEALEMAGWGAPDFPVHALRYSAGLAFPTLGYCAQKGLCCAHRASLYRNFLYRPDHYFHSSRFCLCLLLHFGDWKRRHYYCLETPEELHALGGALCDHST